MRCAVIEVSGNMISDLIQQEEQTDTTKGQIDSFFDLLEERTLDVNPYCRSRLFQVYLRLLKSVLCMRALNFSLPVKFPKKRQRICDLCVRSLEDKSSHVRRNVIKVLTKLISTHPFALLHGGQLSYQEWKERLDAVNLQINGLQPPSDAPGLAENAKNPEEEKVLATEDQETTEQPLDAQQEAATSEDLMKLQLTKRYYTEALKFIESLHAASETISQLLASKNKSEVLESMDFFVVADAYKLATAKVYNDTSLAADMS
jgi:condensin complex subunit 1